MRESFEKTKDLTYRNPKTKENVRATYVYDDAIKDFLPKPKEILIKDRINNINVKKGTDNFQFKSDFRITSSYEKKLP